MATQTTGPAERSTVEFGPAWQAYVVPMAAFAAVTLAEGYAGRWYPALYGLKLFVVAALLVAYRAAWRDIRPSMRVLPAAALVGLLVFAEWVAVERWVPYPRLGGRSAFDPFAQIGDPAARVAFIAARLAGLALLVPLMEELFWRGFLLRYVTNAEWRSVPLSGFSWTAFAVVAGAFALSHPEWPAAAICACAYALLLKQTRSLFACVVAHAITNLALGIYVLTSHAWQLW